MKPDRKTRKALEAEWRRKLDLLGPERVEVLLADYPRGAATKVRAFDVDRVPPFIHLAADERRPSRRFCEKWLKGHSDAAKQRRRAVAVAVWLIVTAGVAASFYFGSV